MTTYTIDIENNVTAFTTAKEAKIKPEAERFNSIEQLSDLAEKWRASRLVEIWNTLPGITQVKKFTSRNTAVRRIWTAIQSLDTGTKRTNTPAQRPHVAREGSKKAEVLSSLQRKGGATLQDLMATTGWQAHSVRGFLSTVGKKIGIPVKSTKLENGVRVYSI